MGGKLHFHKSTERVRARAEELGYQILLTNGGHIKYVHPKVPKPIFGSSTPTDYRGTKNCIKMLERELRRATG